MEVPVVCDVSVVCDLIEMKLILDGTFLSWRSHRTETANLP